MLTVPITSIYAALLTLLFLVLSVRVIAERRASGILLGTAGSPALERAARAHANFAEYVPIGLLLMLLAEASRMPGWLVHVAGLALLAGRLAHAVSVSRSRPGATLRVAGMALTFSALTVSAAALLWKSLFG